MEDGWGSAPVILDPQCTLCGSGPDSRALQLGTSRDHAQRRTPGAESWQSPEHTEICLSPSIATDTADDLCNVAEKSTPKLSDCEGMLLQHYICNIAPWFVNR